MNSEPYHGFEKMRMVPVSRGNFTRVGAKDKRPLGRQRAFVELNTTSPRLQPGGGG